MDTWTNVEVSLNAIRVAFDRSDADIGPVLKYLSYLSVSLLTG
jgi:hypothetical protein